MFLESVRWLRRELTDELVRPFSARQNTSWFLAKVVVKTTDMPAVCSYRLFRKLWSGTPLRSHRDGTPTDTAYARYKWRVAHAPVDAANAIAVRLTWLESDGAAARASTTARSRTGIPRVCAVSLTAKKEGENSEDGTDAVHYLNTCWVPLRVVLKTIGVLNKKLVARHVAMLAHLVAAELYIDR